eukprot:4293928-Amphidinium_carterae.1
MPEQVFVKPPLQEESRDCNALKKHRCASQAGEYGIVVMLGMVGLVTLRMKCQKRNAVSVGPPSKP